jgi:nucleoid-associated protein YgaU
LPPGAQELALSEHDQAGRDIKGDGSVLMVVPTPPSQVARTDATPTGAIAVLSTPSVAPKVLQAAPVPAANPVGPGRLSLDVLDYDDRGQVRFAGTAPAGSTVRVYSDRQPIGDATARRDLRWTLTPEAPIAPGTHDLRVDQLTARGEVVARAGMPFQREQLAARAVAEGSVMVQPGQSLWLIASHAYGTGFRYTVIYQANRDQIRDPDLIYPGQAFAVPMLAAGGEGAATARVTSASSERSR